VSRDGGVITFDTPPDGGLVLTAGYYFDVECRFEDDDSLDTIVRTFGASEFADLAFKEVPPCI
jgi:uncharacterized protein (TIGR02217 family)